MTARATGPEMRLPLADVRSRRSRGPLELHEPGDVLHDYTLVPYDPVRTPAGMLRSVNVLYESFAAAGVEDAGRRVVELVRKGLGPYRTVFGVKLHAADQRPGWELYFYDPTREHRDLSIERVIEVLAPAVTVDARPPRPMPWHMFSVELDVPQLGGAPSCVDVYISTNARVKGTDRSYKVRGSEMVLENVYTFHRPLLEIDQVLYRLETSVHFSRAELPLSAILPPELFRCAHVCVANKRHADGLYFSGITLEQLRFAFEFLGWRGDVPAFVQTHAAELDHLLWDVGFDFVVTNGRVSFPKMSIYGSF